MTDEQKDLVEEELTCFHLEDEAAMRLLVEKMLASALPGLRPMLWADNLAQGLEVLAAHPVDLILLDLFLPDSRGLETLVAVRAAVPQTPIVVLTGQQDADLTGQMLRQGAQEYLDKADMNSKVLLRVVRYAIERKRMENELQQVQIKLEKRVDERTREILLANQRLSSEVEHRREIEEELRRSEEQVRNILDSNPVATAVYDMKGKLIFVNAAFGTLFGWSKQELYGRKLEFVPGELLHELRPRIEMMKKGECVSPFETVRLRKDGGRVNVMISTAPLRGGPEECLLGNIVVFRDITMTKQAQAKAAELAAIVASSDDSIIGVDLKGVITSWNRGAERLYGYPAAEAIGQPVSMLVPEGHPDLKLPYVRGEIDEQKFVQFETVRQAKDGRQVQISLTISPILDEGGQQVGVSDIARDITQRKILEGQLLQAHKLESIGQLAAGIAHEINTPTQYVTDNTRFLRDAMADIVALLARYSSLARQAKDQEQFAEIVEDIEARGQEMDLDYLIEEIPTSIEQTLGGLERIATIVRSMKEFAHPGPENKTTVDINKAIANTITVARNEWKYVSEVETDLDQDLPPVLCIPGQINQVLLNIIVNAAQAIGEMNSGGQKGLIRISTRRVDGQVEIRVVDSGPGIPEKIRVRIFDPFFTTKEPGKGTGQGLAIAHSVIVDKHKGSLTLESQEGRGTTFIIRLPLQRD